MNKIFIISVFTIILFTTGFSQNRSFSYDPYVADTFDLLNNKPFAQLQLEDTTGHIFNTAVLAGKTIYVDFWFTSCPTCLKEIPYSISIQQFFASDTNLVFLNICIDNIERKQVWKQLIHDKEIHGIHLFYVRNRPQKINLLREYEITFPTYLLINKKMKVIGYNAPRPSEEGWVHWAIVQAENDKFLSDSYTELINHSKRYRAFINENWQKIISLRKLFLNQKAKHIFTYVSQLLNYTFGFLLFTFYFSLLPSYLCFVYRCNFFYFCRNGNNMAAKEMNNRSAYHDYFIEDKWTAGIVLLGTEVKSLREGKVSFNDSFCLLHRNELWVRGLYIAEYSLGTTNNHIAVHDRKLLLTKRELRKIENRMKDKGYTIVPLRVFFNDKHIAKVEIGIGRGKKLHDKRETLKKKDTEREIKRYLK